ncbi:MAG: hypothetical protein NTW42_04500 [Deltaproteobacteria bacterium]|nr:hypothetical protein [Deltaproteobacteria bacterium]
MKITISLILGLFCSVTLALAGDLQKQPWCKGLERPELIRPSFYLVGEKNIPTGQTVGIGDVIFYANFKDAQKFYTATEDVLLKDKSPLNPDSIIKTDQRVPVVGTIRTQFNNGMLLDVVEAKDVSKILPVTKLFPVKPDGFLCGDTLGAGMPYVMQSSPMTLTVEELKGGGTRSVAIVLQKIDGAIASVQVSLIVNGQQVKSITRGYDLFAGTINLSGLSMQIKKDGPGIKIISVSEPQDYYVWFHDFFGFL